MCVVYNVSRSPLKLSFCNWLKPHKGCSQGASSRFVVKWQSGSVILIRTFAGTCLSSLADDLAVSYH